MNNEDYPAMEGLICPVPLAHQDQIVMGHGSGGRMTQQLFERVFKPAFDNAALREENDFAAAALPPQASLKGKLSISTDCHIVSPLFFPGGDIGRLAVCGTVNDMCMSGAQPLYLTAGFILEEGLKIKTLERVVESIRIAAEEAGVQIVAGDTKVVEKGKADGLFITTTGIGWIPEGRQIGGTKAEPGDVVLVSGTVGDHGIAVLSARGELGFEAQVVSDTAPLNGLIEAVLAAAPHTHVLRDPTRGGLATTLNEITRQSNTGILIEERAIPVSMPVKAVCEMLGFDPLYIANEGKVVVITAPDEAEAALDAMRAHPYGAMAARIGSVVDEPKGRVLLKTLIGGSRILDVLAGEILPRIC